ncbi:HAD-IIIA family hydrolase [Alginatibacterium sediminis]|uniref:HAD-IIIA family hydrolase n=1 Tax=Alginatibacterium sediminis TaxID=2164068 RepID=A0A420EHJ5_9ALTE|nr:HAD-IIIA family hydrolase [Alginatibacterium sediminis]RKF20138.1 HAD-IIIA family hydrolase [Alginatibacterium sediminis]
MQRKLVVFDWDGTLMDSLHSIVKAMQACARELNLREPSDEQVKSIIGLSLSKANTVLFGALSKAADEALIESYKRHYLSIETSNPSQLYPGIRDLLEMLVERGCLLAVATGKGHNGLDRVMRQSQTLHLFNAHRGADQARSKPDPLMLTQILDQLECDVEQAIMVGDASFDLEMARNKGMHAIGVSYGAQDKQSLEGFAYPIVDSVEELRQTLTAFIES